MALPGDFVGRPGVSVHTNGVQFYGLSLPENLSCHFRWTADQAVMFLPAGESLVKEFFAREHICEPGDDLSWML